MKIFALGLLLAAPMAVSAAPAGLAIALQPASAEEVVAATSACVAAVTPKGTDEAVLLKAGWSRAPIGQAGQAVPASVHVLSNPRNKVLLMTGPGQGKISASCAAVSRVVGPAVYPPIVLGVSARVGAAATRAPTGDMLWARGHVAVQMRPTGSRGQPIVRTTVVYLIEAQR